MTVVYTEFSSIEQYNSSRPISVIIFIISTTVFARKVVNLFNAILCVNMMLRNSSCIAYLSAVQWLSKSDILYEQ